MKRWAIITNKHGIYEFPHVSPNNLSLSLSLLCKIDVLKIPKIWAKLFKISAKDLKNSHEDFLYSKKYSPPGDKSTTKINKPFPRYLQKQPSRSVLQEKLFWKISENSQETPVIECYCSKVAA